MSERSEKYRGATAIIEMLDLIGTPDTTDHDIAKVLVDNEMDIRNMLGFTLRSLLAHDLGDSNG